MGKQTQKPSGGLLSVFGKSWFWFSNVTSVIGLISIVDELKLWIEAAARLMDWAHSIAPALAQALAVIGRAVHAVLEVFRGLARPLFDFLLGWLPFDVPQMAKDAIVVAVFVALGLLRVAMKSDADFNEADNARRDEIAAKARAFGIEVIDGDEQRSPSDIESALHTYWLSIKLSDEQKRSAYAADFRQSEAIFGPNLRPFCDANMNLIDTLHPAINRWIANEERGTWFVWIAAGVTVVLVVLDAFLMH